jgi:hypothetical protein
VQTKNERSKVAKKLQLQTIEIRFHAKAQSREVKIRVTVLGSFRIASLRLSVKKMAPKA